VAKEFAVFLKEGDIVALAGELGSGKTQFAKGIGNYYGIMKIISPSFTIVRQYCGEKTLTHIDLYRINSIDECTRIIDEYLQEQTIIIIEWADKVKDYIPGDAYGVHLNYGQSENERIIEIKLWNDIVKIL
jgi:tRNA threonylcarbamoyladenosine biosynthesis protein TsaE